MCPYPKGAVFVQFWCNLSCTLPIRPLTLCLVAISFSLWIEHFYLVHLCMDTWGDHLCDIIIADSAVKVCLPNLLFSGLAFVPSLHPSRWSALYCKQQQGPELSLAATNCCGGGGGELEVTLSITGPRPLQPFHRTISFCCCTLHNNITFALSLDSFTRLWRLKTSQSQDSFTLWNYREEMVFDSVLENLILLNSKMVGLLKVSDLSC